MHFVALFGMSAVLLAGCSSISAPVILGLDGGAAAQCEGAPVTTMAMSSRSAAAQIPEPVLKTGPMQKYLKQLDTAQQAPAPVTVMSAGGRDQVRGVAVRETRMELGDDEFKDFMKQFSEHVLSVGSMASQTNDVFVTSSGQAKDLMRLYRFYLIAYSQGKYVDRRGTKYDAPDLASGISNKVLTSTLAIFLDTIADFQFGEPVLTDGKVYYPYGKADEPTVLKAGALSGVTKMSLVEDPKLCGLTKEEAKAISVIGALAEKKSALVSGIAAEAVSGWDISFVIGGRFAFGDNKMLAELIKIFFAVSARRASERAAYSFFHDFSYTKESVPAFLLDVGLALSEEKKP